MAKISCASPELTAKVVEFLSLKNAEVSANIFKKKKIKKQLALVSMDIEHLVKREDYEE